MFISILIILLITTGGSVLTYLRENENALIERLCAGNIIGSALFGSLTFLLACFFGLNAATIIGSLFILFFPFLLFTKKSFRENFSTSFWKVQGKLQSINLNKVLNFAFYIGLFLLLYFFFERALIETENGFVTGSTHNYGDLSFHLGAILSFTEGNNFPPENPSFANAKFTYPFIVDVLTACSIKLGSGISKALLVQNTALGFSLFVLFEKFARDLTKNRLAGKLSVIILLFCGGLGFLIFFCDYAQDGRSLYEFLWHLPADYTIRHVGFRWGNSLTTLFMTQRSLLLGMPVTIIILTEIWRLSSSEKIEKLKNENDLTQSSAKEFSVFYFPPSIFWLGLLAGTLPLIHVHSLFVLFIVSAFLLLFSLNKWREWLAFGIAVMIFAVPELLWMATGSATRFGEFIGWHFGWGAGEENIFIFWFKNSGLFIPILILGLVMAFYRKRWETGNKKTESAGRHRKSELIFYAPFIFIFIVAHLVRFAPSEWDNIKVLIYWFVASVPFAALGLAVLWEKRLIGKVFVVGCLIVLTLSGVIDVWRVESRQINIKFFDKDAVAIAEQIKQKTSPKALFLNAPVYNTAVVLSGRRSLMRFSAHLASYGIDYLPREEELKEIYKGSPLAESLLKKNNIEYVIISPEESDLEINKEFFAKYPKIAEAGQYSVYQIR